MVVFPGSARGEGGSEESCSRIPPSGFIARLSGTSVCSPTTTLSKVPSSIYPGGCEVALAGVLGSQELTPPFLLSSAKRRSHSRQSARVLSVGGASLGYSVSRSSSHGVTFAVTKAETSMDTSHAGRGSFMTARAEAISTLTNTSTTSRVSIFSTQIFH